MPQSRAGAVRRLLRLVVPAMLIQSLSSGAALAWGATGHRLIGEAAMASLPASLPAFLRAPAAAQQVGELAREPDRSKGSGQPHDRDLDPGHFIDVDDAGKVGGGPPLAALPGDRQAYDAALRAAGSNAYACGYLPYNIEDGFEQVTKDLAYWRVETAALRTDHDPAERAWISRDLALRESLTLRDIGWLAHFVGDGSQPMHVSVHHSGWGAYPNPHGYTQARIHAAFEGAFVRDHVSLAAVETAMTPARTCAPIAACTAAYLQATASEVEPLYGLWGDGSVFAHVDPRAVAFTAARVAAGASELRDLIASAWRASDQGVAGYQPSVTVRAAEAGAAVPMAALYGSD